MPTRSPEGLSLRAAGLATVLLLAAASLGLAACSSDSEPLGATPGSPEASAAAPTEITRQIFASEGVGEDQELYLYEVVIPAGEEIAAHTHPGLQMATIREGTLTYEIIEGTATVIRAAGTPAEQRIPVSGQTVELAVGDAVIEPEGMIHQAANLGDGPVRIALSALFARNSEMSSPVPGIPPIAEASQVAPTPASTAGQDGDTPIAGPPLADPAATGRQLVDRFIGSLKGADTDTVALSAILAPNFQLVRADDSREDRRSYLAEPALVNDYSIAKLRAVPGTDDGAPTLTVSFDITVDEVIEGEHIDTTAPRLGTFQWDGNDWLLVSWANFNPVE